MADKGFDLKLLVPTNDGITHSDKSFEETIYYLIYNLSNRSYQLAGKGRMADLFNPDKSLSFAKLNDLIVREHVDMILSKNPITGIDCKSMKPEESEISKTLLVLIDKIDQKKELTD